MQDVIEAHKQWPVKSFLSRFASEFVEIDALAVGAMRSGMQVAIISNHEVVFAPAGKTVVLWNCRCLVHGAIVQLAPAFQCR